MGIARVYVDGALKGTVDAYASPAQSQAVLYTVTGLTPGTHTMTIEATGAKSPVSTGYWISVDAFDINP
jgi:hypothetical protein